MSIMHQALRRGALIGAFAACLLSPTMSQAAQVRHAGNLSYVCGGVGEGELHALQAQALHYNLGFWMVEGPRGAYLADVPIRIRHQGKTVAEFTAGGPLCYVQAPAGTYTIEGTHKQQQRKITLHTGNKNAYLRW
ncbi:MAG: hypothetical protein B7Z83_10965 [Thiomonas sp. 20-64-5]|nr:MAG: hypothetical protein B7Z83_10965 [Thiomonas sp. 20-64-5]